MTFYLCRTMCVLSGYLQWNRARVTMDEMEVYIRKLLIFAQKHELFAIYQMPLGSFHLKSPGAVNSTITDLHEVWFLCCLGEENPIFKIL